MGADWVHVFVIYRVDDLGDVDSEPRHRITIKEVLPSNEHAEAELGRLNADKPGRYFCQVAKYYPGGRAVGGTLPTTSTKS